MSLKPLMVMILAICCFVTNAQNEQYVFSRLDALNGLSNNQVNTIRKDHNGFIWFGTMSGLNRYDGYTVKVFKNNPNDSTSLVDNYVNSIWECPDNKFWVISRAGVSVYDPVKEKFNRDDQGYLRSLQLPTGTVNHVKKDSKNNYWFVYDSAGVYKVGHDKKVQRFVHDDNITTSISSNTVTNITEDDNGHLWLIHRNGILEILDGDAGKIIYRSTMLKQMLKGEYSYNMFIDKDRAVWIWTTQPLGLFYVDTSDNSAVYNESSAVCRLNNNLVNGVTQDDHGNIWVATDHGGINLINKRSNSIKYLLNDPENAKSLGQNSINTLYRDNNGIIWIGTYKQGVSYFNENLIKFAHYKHKASDRNSLPYDDVNRFVEDKKGNLWIGTNGGGLIYFDRQLNKFYQYLHDPNNQNSLSSNVIVSLCIDHEEKLWIGTYLGGLNCFDGKKFIHYRHNPADPNSVAEDRIWEIMEDAKKNLWIGTLGKGVDKFDRKSGRFIHFQNVFNPDALPQSDYIMAIQEDKKGNLWIGTSGGIEVFDFTTNKATHYNSSSQPNSLSNDNVLSIHEDNQGRMWVGTREGLNLYNDRDNNFRTFTKSDGLADNTVLTILEDNNNNLWITTPNGVSNLILKKDFTQENIIEDIKNYDEITNLQGKEFNENAALKTKKGELILGGPYGFNIIEASFLHKKQPKPKIVFTNFQVFNKDIAAGDMINGSVIINAAIAETNEITLRSKENFFSIEYASLDFSHGNGDKYAYMLEGFNKDWLTTDGKERKATYTNLDPGTYYFKVKAFNSEGVWTDEKQLKITVLPPFWKTPLAFTIYGLVIAGILFLARKITVERTRMKYEVVLQKKEADRMHALDTMKTKFFTNVSHEFRTPLSLILSPLDKVVKNTHDPNQKNQLQLIQRNAKRLLQLVNQLLDFRKMEVQQFILHPSVGDVVVFCKDISSSFSDIAEHKGISFTINSEVEKLEMYFDKDKLEKILFNLLSNAFKYTPNNGEVGITLSLTQNDRFRIKVRDTGIGIPTDKQEKIFERFFQNVPESMDNQGSGIGLAITREFVRLHNGEVSVESEPDKGTTFVVDIPVRTVDEAVKTPSLAELPNVGSADSIILPPHDVKKRPTILVVEDNEDFRFYLKDNLKQKYNVIEAADGKLGWQMVKEHLPDLVVSDIMMPFITGIELSKRIKNDPRTAQIPVVLLTAMNDEESQIEGYNIGINDYIPKPFTFEILETRIRNILVQQKQLIKNIQRQVEVNPTDTPVTSADEQFMTMISEAVERNISNADYSVEDLSRDLFMSRVAVYKKILALTRKTPIEFIRTMRMKRAAQLLSKSQMPVSQIAYEVGYNNPKIFSKYFKEEYKMSPSQYQKTHSLPDNKIM